MEDLILSEINVKEIEYLAEDSEILVKKIKPNLAVSIYNDPHQALDEAMKKASKKDLVLVTGSFFLVGELRKKWVSEEYILKNLRFDKK